MEVWRGLWHRTWRCKDWSLSSRFFCLDLLQYFFTMLFSLHSGMVMNILYHYILEVGDLDFDFDFIRNYNKWMHDSQKRLWRILNILETVVDYRNFWNCTKWILHYDMAVSIFLARGWNLMIWKKVAPKMGSTIKKCVDRGFSLAWFHSCSVPKKHTKIDINYKLVGLLVQASY